MNDVLLWMKRKLQDAPRVTRGESDPSGHPHSWCGLVIPDWEWKQMIEQLEHPEPEGEDDIERDRRSP